ncbi:MAG: hypothetical protein HYR67_07855 [Bacteroidetes bacterium]|nr:hypothetical protein [Bacteroidota bacterium]
MRKLAKLMMGVLLLVTFSFSIPSVSQQRSCTQTELVQIKKAENQQSCFYQRTFKRKLSQYRDQDDEFNCRVAYYKIIVLVQLRQNKSRQFDITIRERIIPKIITSEKSDSLS